MLANLFRRLWDNPYVMLAGATAMWGGNAVAGKLAVGEMSPMVITALRWLLACGLMAPFVWRNLRADLPLLRPHWLLVTVMATLGYTGFNALFYAAAHHTAAVNLTIIQGGIPVMVAIGAYVFFATPIRLWQVVGMVVTMAGVLTVASRGDFEVLRTLAFNIGDVWMLFAALFYAVYTIALRKRPAVSSLGFFAAMAAVALVTSLPLLAYEILTQTVQWPTPKGWLILAYVAVFPSLLSQLFYMRGVELIGPGRAGLFVNLVPVFGAAFAVLILSENFRLYHGLSLALVLGGIALAERAKR